MSAARQLCCTRQNGFSVLHMATASLLWWTTTMAPQNGFTCSRVHSSAHIATHARLTPKCIRNHPSPCLQASCMVESTNWGQPPWDMCVQISGRSPGAMVVQV